MQTYGGWRRERRLSDSKHRNTGSVNKLANCKWQLQHNVRNTRSTYVVFHVRAVFPDLGLWVLFSDLILPTRHDVMGHACPHCLHSDLPISSHSFILTVPPRPPWHALVMYGNGNSRLSKMGDRLRAMKGRFHVTVTIHHVLDKGRVTKKLFHFWTSISRPCLNSRKECYVHFEKQKTVTPSGPSRIAHTWKSSSASMTWLCLIPLSKDVPTMRGAIHMNALQE